MTHREGAAEFAEALSEARKNAGEPTYNSLARLAFSKFGDTAPTEATIRHYHTGRVTPRNADLALVAMLANAYGVGVGSLSSVLGERLERERAEINASFRCTSASVAA